MAEENLGGENTPSIDAAGGEAGAPATQTQEGTAAEVGKSAEVAGEPSTTSAELEGAPEKYELVAPEGTHFDTKAVAEIAKELNLSQAAAQKLVDKLAPAAAQQNTAVLDAARTQWAESLANDKELGGPKGAEIQAAAASVFAQFGSPELKGLLEASGLGNHPELVRWAYNVSKTLSEDKTVRGGSGAVPEQAKSLEERAAQKLYGSTTPA